MKLVTPPIQWNVPTEGSIPLNARVCKDHPAVRPTAYMEVSDILGTSGCSKHNPWWVSDVMGVIETERGRIVVCPGDWILEPLEGVYLVVSDEEYQKLISSLSSSAINPTNEE